MADNNVIDAYIGDVREALGSYRYRERVLAEISDHLEQRVEALIAAGYTQTDARTAAIRALGDPRSYVADFASVRAMPTAFTRRAGLVGLCGAPLLGLGFAQPSDGKQAEAVFVGVVLCCILLRNPR